MLNIFQAYPRLRCKRWAFPHRLNRTERTRDSISPGVSTSYVYLFVHTDMAQRKLTTGGLGTCMIAAP